MKSQPLYFSSLVVILIFFFTGFNSELLADSWRVGSGGQSSRNSLSTESGPEAANILWQNGVSAVIAQQAVIDGNIVAMSRITNLNNVLHGTSIVAQNLTTGDTLWTRDLPVGFPSTDWRNRVSAMNSGAVYATRAGNTNYSFMYALDTTDGSILWQSEGLVNESSTESCAFTANGDLVVGNFDNIICINHTDGTTIWLTDRSCPSSNGQEVSVFGTRGYYWEPSPSGPIISVIDLETGNHLFSSEALSAGLIQQLGIFIGPDGTIYAPRSMNNAATDFLIALQDNGDSFTQLWSTPIGYVPFSTSGVSPDGTIYTYSSAGEVIRLDPADGSLLNTSEVIFTSIGVSPRMAIDANGYVFVTNGEFATGKLFSFNPDLTTRWTENVTNVNIGGPAIGSNGTMVVCGVGTNVRAYQGSNFLIAGFTAEDTEICAEESIQFIDQSIGSVSSWEWDFEGGYPPISTLPDPIVSFPESGWYDVTLVVSDGSVSDTLTKVDYISVMELPEVTFAALPEFFCYGYNPPYELTEGLPEGGTYYGPGVIEGIFYPDSAGLGLHTLGYFYMNNNGCADTAFQETEVVICEGIGESEFTDSFSIFPNPAINDFEIRLKSGFSGTIFIEVLNPLYELVLAANYSIFQNEEFSVILSARELESGLYFILIRHNNKIISVQKLIVR